MPEPMLISDAEFQEKVLNAALPVIVDFWRPGCGPCRMIAPELKPVANDHRGRLLAVKVNVDRHEQWMRHFGVQSIPTLLFIADGQVKSRHIGHISAPLLRARIEGCLTLVQQQSHTPATGS